MLVEFGGNDSTRIVYCGGRSSFFPFADQLSIRNRIARAQSVVSIVVKRPNPSDEQILLHVILPIRIVAQLELGT